MKLFAWLFGFLVLAIGLINTFWGNDPGYGIFVMVASLLYFPPITDFLAKKAGIAVPLWVQIILGFLIFWTALGVAELSDKIDLMVNDLATTL
ncbi:hypothetical protein [Allomuricauda sp. M10]|jgi:hypothetical protein|uniref:hypothetical protein n=1 Tax=Allomuricauda sp. M10 TaxID=2683292 RepID=UPI001D17FE0F|nr:hypothetical protein [Muricauda sp. M10]